MTAAQRHGLTAEDARAATARVVRTHPVIDIHTHLFSPRFNRHDPGFLLWGIDELLDYHYLHAEVLRASVGRLSPAQLLGMPQRDRADLIWRKLFRERAPISEACRGVITTLTTLGLDPETDNLSALRNWFALRDPDAHVDDVMQRAGIERITMTNEVFDARERSAWLADDSLSRDPRFAPVARIDRLLCEPERALAQLADWGYDDADGPARARRFVSDWIRKTNAVYVAASLPPVDARSVTPGVEGDRLLHEAVLPALAEHGLPLALMIGVRRGVNPALASAGDGVGQSDLRPLGELCQRAQTHDTRLLVTMLAREDQHALCVLARKYANLIPFGCWWFLNTPSMIVELTRMRLEMLGTSFIPQHSDARVLEQLIYKWQHSRQVIADVLGDHFAQLVQAGGCVTEEQIAIEVDRLFRGNALGSIPYASATA